MGAVDVPLWFTHFGWTGSPDEQVSLENQAKFVDSGIRRARTEWPWVGLIFNWTYSVVPTAPETSTMSLILNGNPTPLMNAMVAFARSDFGSSMTNGFAPADSNACTYEGNWQDQHLVDGLYRTVRDQNATVTCQFWGTGVSTFFRFSPDAGTARYVIDQPSFDDLDPDALSGTVFLTYRVSDAFEAPVALVGGLPEGMHTITIGIADPGELVIGGFLVERERPMIWPIAVLVVAGLVALFLGLRALAYIAAEHAGLVSPQSSRSTQPPMPSMPEWKPGPRFSRQR